MSSSMRASPSSTLYWSCAKYSQTTLWPRRTEPAVGGSAPVSRRMSVDLPAPLTPTSATRSPRSMVKLHPAEHLLGAVALGEPVSLHHHAPRGRRLGKLEVDRRLFFGNLDALDLFQLLNAALHLLGLGGLGAEAVDEGFKVLDLLALVAVSRDAAAPAARLFALDIWCNCPDRWSSRLFHISTVRSMVTSRK